MEKGAHQPKEHAGDVNMPDLEPSQKSQQRDDRHHDAVEHIREQHNAQAREAVGSHPADEQEDQHWHRRENEHRPHGGGRMRLLQHPPCQRDAEQAVTQAGGGLPAQ